MSDDGAEKMATARAKVLFKAPYYAAIIHGFIYTPVPETLTKTMMVTDRMVLGYSAAWVKIATVEQLAADLAHEVNHVLRQTFQRGASRSNKRLFNIAADLAINPDLKEGGWQLAEGPPLGAIFPEMYDLPPGKTAEEYYDLLMQMPEPPPCEGGGICSGHCGGLTGAPDAITEEQTLNVQEQGRSDIEIQVITARAAHDMKEHFEKSRGNAPGYLQDLIDATNQQPYVRWEDELAMLLHMSAGRVQAGGHDFSFARPSKRSYMRGILRPGLLEYSPEVAIVTDTSGSMSREDIKRAAVESAHILQALGVDDIWFCEADAAISLDWKRVGPEFFQMLQVCGRGGTDFRPAIAAAENLNPRPDLLVYLTDGDGQAPDNQPQGMEVIWGIVPNRKVNRAPAAWGQEVIISDDPKIRRKK